MSQPLWDWVLLVYGRPGVEAACLSLQDDHDQSVPYLLWAAWMARQGRTASLGQGAVIAAEWEGEVTGLLRQVRRRLKGEGVDLLRDRVKAAELQAECVLLERLQALAEPGDSPRPLLQALAAASASWRQAASIQALEALAEAID